VARRRERLELLGRQLRESRGTDVEILVADLTQAGDLRTVERRLSEEPSLDLLVNNAGFAGYMPFVELDPDRAEELIKLHVIAATRLTRAALPGMVARGRGAIINVSSLLAFSASLPAQPLPYRATYAACKAYLNTFSEILHNELEGTGVRVQVLCPGLVRTEFHSHVPGFDLDRIPATPLLPEQVVRASLAGLRQGEVVCIPTLEDPSAVAQHRESQQRLLQGNIGGSVASRYADAQ
jgi:uncharacterized protein